MDIETGEPVGEPVRSNYGEGAYLEVNGSFGWYNFQMINSSLLGWDEAPSFDNTSAWEMCNTTGLFSHPPPMNPPAAPPPPDPFGLEALSPIERGTLMERFRARLVQEAEAINAQELSVGGTYTPLATRLCHGDRADTAAAARVRVLAAVHAAAVRHAAAAIAAAIAAGGELRWRRMTVLGLFKSQRGEP